MTDMGSYSLRRASTKVLVLVVVLGVYWVLNPTVEPVASSSVTMKQTLGRAQALD